MSADKHELTCAYDDCAGRAEHLAEDIADVQMRLREVLERYGIEGRLPEGSIAEIRRCYRRLRDSAAR